MARHKGPLGPRNRCQYHCVTCDSCFAGLGAFDAHRNGGYCEEPEDVENRDGVKLLAVKTREGVCSYSRPPRKLSGRTIWQETASLGFSGISSRREWPS